jgi:signal transduction histidine kinase
MASGSRLSHVIVALATMAAALQLSRRRLAVAAARIAELEARSLRLAEEAQRCLRLKDDFLATLSHELRTPLNAMLGWVQLLRIHADNARMREHAIDVVERSARGQVQIVADMLDVSRIITGQMQLAFDPLDLGAIVRAGSEASADAAAAKGVDLRIALRPIDAAIHGDAARLRQVVWNLVSNAVKFTPPGGRVSVSLQQVEHAAVITVEDTGVGIAAEVLPFVFDRFRQGDSSLTRQFGGIGLGLAIVRHLVELHGGSVEAASDGRDRGATFTIRLPIRPERPTG